MRELLAQKLDERPPGARLGVEVLEPRARLGVGRIGLEDLLEAGDRVLVLAELVGPQRGDPPVQRHARRRIGRRLGLARQDLDQIAVAPLRLVAPRQRRQRRRVIGLERQDVQVGRHHHDVEVQPIAVDGHDLQVTVDLLVDVRGRNRVEIVLQELEQRVPLLGGRVELAQRRHRLGQVRPQAQEALPDLDRLVGVLRPLLGGARHLDPHRHAPVEIRFGLLGLGEHRQELRQLVPRGVVGPIELDHLAVGGDRACVRGGICVASLTDLLDGRLARRRGLVTDFGKIADPVADKALTGAALICLSALGELPWWVTGVIMFREIGVTALRFWVIRRGVIAASRGGKLKTLLQVIAICLYVLPSALSPPGIVRGLVMAAAVVVTVVTGVDYVQQAMRLRRSEPAPGG